MTREEMDFIGGMNMCDEISNEAYKKIMCHCEEQEPKTGRWIEERDDFGELLCYHCSNCYDDTGFMSSCAWNFCPECGAKMEKFPVRAESEE